MKELNNFRKFLNESPAYDIGGGQFEITSYVKKVRDEDYDEDYWELNDDAVAKYIKSQTYNDSEGPFTPDDQFIQDIMSFDDFREDLEGIADAFSEGEELSEPEIEKVIDQAVNFYLGNY